MDEFIVDTSKPPIPPPLVTSRHSIFGVRETRKSKKLHEEWNYYLEKYGYELRKNDHETDMPDSTVDERMTIETVDICCNCGNVMHQHNIDHYDTLGSDSGRCCPDCGNENFRTVNQVLASETVLSAALIEASKFVNLANISTGSANVIKDLIKKATAGN